jgi:pre-mRNA-splicing factor CWC22
MPPARRGGDDSFSSMPPARRGGEDSFSAMPPARRGAEESFGSMPPARRSAPATNGRASSSGGGRRRAEDSASRMPAARESYSRPAARREDSYDRLPAARREDSYDRLPAVRREDSYDQLSVTSTSVRADSYDRLPAVSDSRRAAHRAEDLTPEFGRPQKRRGVDPDQGSARRLLPAMSSVEESMPPARMPKHGRPEDYGHLPSSRSGPEDSYDQLPAVERRAASGGRRRRA